MDSNQLTQKSQEALSAAQSLAAQYGHNEVDGEHLLVALLGQENGLAPRLFQKMDVPVESFKARLGEELARRPKLSGPGTEAGKIYVTQRLERLFAAAQDSAKRMQDEYVSVEHLLLAFLAEGDVGPSGKIFTEFNVTTDRFLSALGDVRGSQRVTSADPEGTYEALEKYGHDLVQAARDGKLDPIIGRDDEILRVIRIL
jgi:ATP-dependent Clp protease ATP-binding subunit ClpB